MGNPGGWFSPDGNLTYQRECRWQHRHLSPRPRDREDSRAAALPKGVNEPAGGNSSSFTPRQLAPALHHNGPTAPGDLWVYTLADGKSHQVTHSLVGGVRSEDMVEPFLVHYPSKDGKWTISAFSMCRYNMARNGQNAAIVYVHGGPTAQTMNSFNRFVQYMVNQGYMVIAPNYRGSTGYGKEFQQANLFDMGGGDLQDVLAAPTGSSRPAIRRSQETDR
jgi:dipeptidyl aminopeptidase/acylaminoacyl peptidase